MKMYLIFNFKGGRDKKDRPLLTFPADAADLVDMYSSAGIIHLMQVKIHNF